MTKTLRLFFFFILLAWPAAALAQSQPPITFREADGSPKLVQPTEVVVPNGSLTVSGRRVTLLFGTLSGSFTSGQVAVANGASSLTSDSDLTFATDTLTATKIITTQLTDSGLTSGRIPIAGTGGLLGDDSGLSKSGTGATLDLTVGRDLIATRQVTAQFQTITPLSDLPSVTLRRFGSSQTNPILQWQTEANALLGGVAPDGSVYAPKFGVDATHLNTVPSVNGDTFTLNAASQALTNKTINGNTFTTGTYTLTGTAGKTLNFTNSLTFTGTDSSSVAFGAGGTVLYSGGSLFTLNAGSGTGLTAPGAVAQGATVTVGATTDAVVFGSFKAAGTGGAGYTEYVSQASVPSAPASGFREYADSSGRKSWIRASDGFTRTWDATLTANRVYTLKDATGTIPLLETANIWTVNGALSAPGATFNGTWISGGTATTTKPYILIEPTGTTSTTWSTSGTGLGVNAASGFAGNLASFQVAAVVKALVSSDGSYRAVESDVQDLEIYSTLADALAQTTSSRMGTWNRNTGITVNSGAGFGISANAGGANDGGANTDTRFTRISAGLFGVGMGAAGSFAGSLKATTLNAVTNVLIGTPTAPSANNTAVLVFSDNTSKPTLAANTTALYEKSNEVYVQDSAGNESLISPHDLLTNEWIFLSCNSRLNKCIKINMEQVVHAVEQLSGKKFSTEWRPNDYQEIAAFNPAFHLRLCAWAVSVK